VLTLAFTLFGIWRLSRRKADRVVESRETFLTYPQTSPEIYGWLPYHRDRKGRNTTHTDDAVLQGEAPAPTQPPAGEPSTPGRPPAAP